MSIHAVKRKHTHLAWDNRPVSFLIPPAIRIQSGDTVEFDCLDASNGQITSASTASSLRTLDFSLLDQVNGPVYVDSANPGDVLQVDILSVTPSVPWGWSATIPGFGLLADVFPDPVLKIWELCDYENGAGYTWLDKGKGIRVPLRPFAGEMGVARALSGAHSTIPPYATGGNLDTRHVTAGSTLYLPVEVPGALFSMGDGHAAQGDGEVCGTAIETSIRATVRLSVLKDPVRTALVKSPHFSTSRSPPATEESYCTTGVGPDIRGAARTAVRAMIAVLQTEYALGKEEAYMLCSVAGDLRMHEVVDMPNYVIGFMLPKSIFTKPAAGHMGVLSPAAASGVV